MVDTVSSLVTAEMVQLMVAGELDPAVRLGSPDALDRRNGRH